MGLPFYLTMADGRNFQYEGKLARPERARPGP